MNPLLLHTPRLDSLVQISPAMREAERRVQWRHFEALLQQGIPARDLVRRIGHGLTFGIVTIQGREMVVTEDARLRAYFTGPGLFAMPGDYTAQTYSQMEAAE